MAEVCHLKDCGREAVIGTMEKWGPEYRVAMCEHHVMERLARLPAALEALKKYGKHGILCRYGLLPEGESRQDFSIQEDERLEAMSTKECTCGLLAAIRGESE